MNTVSLTTYSRTATRRFSRRSPRETLRDAVTVVRKVLEADRRARRKRGDAPPRLFLSDTSRSHVHRLCEGMTEELRSEAEQLLDQYMQAVRDLDSAEQSLAAIPSDEDVADQVRRLQEAVKDLAIFTDRCDRLDADIAPLQAQLTDLEQKILARRRDTVEKELATERLPAW